MAKFARTTQEELDAYGAKWIPRMRLQGWDIRLVVNTTNKDLFTGQAEVDCYRHAAILHFAPNIRRKLATHPLGIGVRKGREVEQCVVHELHHVQEGPYDRKLRGLMKDSVFEVFNDYRETMIELSTRTLLEADAAGAWTA